MSAAMWKESSTTPLSISRRMEERAEPSGEGGVRRMELKQISTPSGTYQIYVGIRIESLKRRRPPQLRSLICRTPLGGHKGTPGGVTAQPVTPKKNVR